MFRAAGHRHGIVDRPAIIPTTMADFPGIWHASVPGRNDQGHPPAGGVGLTRAAAETAALGEGLERYAAALHPLPGRPRHAYGDDPMLIPLERFSLFDDRQIADPAFPYGATFGPEAGALPYTDVYSLVDNVAWRAPSVLVGLSGPPHGLATSSGLAAAPSRHLALLRATQELIERDALMTTWHHCLPGRRIPLPSRWGKPAADMGAQVWGFDLTPRYSPHPVAAVCGSLTVRGRPRIAIGAACRSTWSDALDKAFLEWAQGILFAGVVLAQDPDRRYKGPADVRGFEDHAAYYTFHPDRWANIPLHARAFDAAAPPDSPRAHEPPAEQLRELVETLTGAGVGLWYRDLTLPDLAQAGVAVARVLSPDLAAIHADQRWPFLGGRTRQLKWRYDLPPQGPFPNPQPHPLG